MSYKVLRDCKHVPFPVRQAFGVANHNDDPMRLMWRDVAARMALDACGVTGLSKKDKSEYREHLMSMGEAQYWFRNEFDDMLIVFELAEVDMVPVRRHILNLINRSDFHEPTDPE